MSSVAYRVPDTISSFDAFVSLYNHAKVPSLGTRATLSGLSPIRTWNAVQMFRHYCPGGECDYVRGKAMLIDFTTFPLLDVSKYDENYGKGAAASAIEENKNPFKYRTFWSGVDLEGDACKFFYDYWKERTPKEE